MDNSKEIIVGLMKQFGEDVPIKKIAHYAEDEFYIPYEVAVKLIDESVVAESE